ncbi:hypothetical protein MSAN_00500000 [Mycena sanguinolenta]|uniref:Uncharacterized protein n=1 Tax=Mycena sanguinolenta TaxID=230812 RepID=A0A8H6Z5H2_9AGAR|nr:hypothetical protein MSAN_00500000 [Mycena sanguinolenta]
MELDEHQDHAQIVEFSDEVGQISPEEIPMEVDHLSDNDLSSVGSDSENDYGGLELDELEADEWADFDEEADYDIPISHEEMVRELEEMLDADEEGALWDNRNEILTEQDRDNISAFQLKMISNMPRVAFEQMRHAFRHKLDISLLKDRFSHPKYHIHLCELADIIKTILSFTYTTEILSDLEEKIISWVETYERYYYQYREDRLCACPLTIHGMFHVVPDIRFCGPSWTTWTFFMERYCGFLKHGLRSRSQPWANLNNRMLHYAYLEQIAVRYDLTDELAIFGQRTSGLSEHESAYENYPYAVLIRPKSKDNVPDDELRKKIATYFRDLIGSPINKLLPLLPQNMPRWGKLRIIDGDSITTAFTLTRGEKGIRDKSYVRYEIEVRKRTEPDNKMHWVPQVCYGRLEQILVCELPDNELFGAFAGKTRLLAVLIPCSTAGRDATKEILSYTQTNSKIVADLQSVSAVIGRMQTRGKWVIIDRTAGLIKPEFVPSAEAE